MLSLNEKRAISELKEDLIRKYNLIDLKLFGSKIREKETNTKDSDIDIFIVLAQYNWEIEKQVYELCFEISLKYDVLLSPIIYSRKEIQDEVIKATPFYQVVKKEGVSV